MSLNDLKNYEIILENDCVKLEPLVPQHFDLLKKIAIDPQLWSIAVRSISCDTDLKKYIETAITERAQSQSYTFTIFNKASGEIAGSTRLMSFSAVNLRCEIGNTWLAKKFHGTGLNKSCKYELLKFAFNELNLNRVELKTDVKNLQSRKAILKIGAKEEGIFRNHMITYSGRVRDSIYYSIIKEEWPQIKNIIFNINTD